MGDTIRELHTSTTTILWSRFRGIDKILGVCINWKVWSWSPPANCIVHHDLYAGPSEINVTEGTASSTVCRCTSGEWNGGGGGEAFRREPVSDAEAE